MEGDCWFVLALKLSWQTVWPNLTPLLYDTSLLPAGIQQFSRITFWSELKLSWDPIIMGITQRYRPGFPSSVLSKPLYQSCMSCLLTLSSASSTFKIRDITPRSKYS